MKVSIILLLATTLCVCSFQIEPATSSRLRPTSLSGFQGFPYYIGQNFGQDKVTAFLNFINTAATLYRDDLQKNLKYIQTNMQDAFGVGTITYSLIIQANSTSSVTDTFIYRQYSGSASFPTGTCMINPTWSYFLYILDKEDGRTNQYIPFAGQGTTISLATVNEIKTIIQKRDGTRKCTCQQAFSIQLDLFQFDRQYWNVLCHSQPISAGYVLVRDHHWISMKPFECYYMFYVI